MGLSQTFHSNGGEPLKIIIQQDTCQDTAAKKYNGEYPLLAKQSQKRADEEEKEERKGKPTTGWHHGKTKGWPPPCLSNALSTNLNVF